MIIMKLKILIFVLAAIIGFAVYLFFNRSNPVLYRHVDRASVQYSAFVILNPFRDREPERQAEIVLQRLKNRQCQQALSLHGLDSARVEYLCEREKEYPLESWSLMDRKGNGQKAELIYTVNRSGSDGKISSSLAWINVENNGEWRAISYDTFY
jgi:hypothetical protein